MKKLRLSAIILSIASVIAFPGCTRQETPQNDDKSIEITVFSIGKADSILIQTGENTMLIDCGEESDADHILDELGKRNITHLDYLQITHFDKDHVGGAAAVVGQLDIDNIMYPDYEGTRSEYRNFMQAISSKSGASVVAEKSDYTLGDAVFTVYPADEPDSFVKDDSEYDNELSLVTKLTFGDNKFIFAGDAEKKRLKQMIKQGVDWSCDWIKLPHHGNYCKQLSGFLGLCEPEYSVMTISEAEPADEDLTDLLQEMNIRSYDTLGGDVVTVSDGKTITVSTGS